MSIISNNLPGFVFSTLLIVSSPIWSQKQLSITKADSTFKPTSKLWGLVFGDYYYKSHADSAGSGGANQYTGIPQSRTAFQIRRIFLGYNYEISTNFSTEFLLAAEDNTINSAGVPSGDLLSDNKLSFYIRLANLRWKNIWKGTDFIIGEVYTPTFALLSDAIWGYRSVERTIADIRRSPSFDLGATLQGKFDVKNGNYGYNLMIGNGTSAKPENDNFKKFYGEVYAKFLDKKLVIDLYGDYERQQWDPNFHHSRVMLKGFIAYTTPKFTIATESFISQQQKDVVGNKGLQKDTLTANAWGISVFVKGQIIPDKLGFFARYDNYNPDKNYNTNYTSYTGLSSNYEPNYKERFILAGLDFTPAKNIHFIPNVWYNSYQSQQINLSGSMNNDYDLVYRLTFYYSYGR